MDRNLVKLEADIQTLIGIFLALLPSAKRTKRGEKNPKHSNIDRWMCPYFAYLSHRLVSVVKSLTLRKQKSLRRSLHPKENRYPILLV